MGGGPTVQAAPVSDEEKALQKSQADNLAQQTAILKQQAQTQQLLAPYIYKQAGIIPQTDEQGNITGFTQDPNFDPNAGLRTDIETQLLKRSQAALAGTLPVDPTVTNALNDQESSLKERLTAQFGPGYASTTPGIQALNDFATKKAGILGAASRDDLSLSEQLGLAQTGSNQDVINTFLNRMGIPGGSSLQLGSAFAQNASGYGAAQQPFQAQRQALLSAGGINAQSSVATQGQYLSLLGSGAGIGAAVII